VANDLWMTAIPCWGYTVRNDDMIGPTSAISARTRRRGRLTHGEHHLSPRLYKIVYFCFELAHKSESSLCSTNVLTSQDLSVFS